MDLLDEYNGMISPEDSQHDIPKCPGCGSTNLHVFLYYSYFDKYTMNKDGTLSQNAIGHEVGDLEEVHVECKECGEFFEGDLVYDPTAMVEKLIIV